MCRLHGSSPESQTACYKRTSKPITDHRSQRETKNRDSGREREREQDLERELKERTRVTDHRTRKYASRNQGSIVIRRRLSGPSSPFLKGVLRLFYGCSYTRVGFTCTAMTSGHLRSHDSKGAGFPPVSQSVSQGFICDPTSNTLYSTVPQQQQTKIKTFSARSTQCAVKLNGIVARK